MVASLRNVDEDLASQVAAGLGIDLPDPLPRALPKPRKPEVTTSSALSLTALPGETGIRTRRIAILVANGAEGKSLMAIHEALTNAGAVPRFVGPRLGTYSTLSGDTIDADASLENSPAVLFDAMVLPDGDRAVRELASDGHTKEFVMNQFRHCKTILALGASSALLESAGVPNGADSEDLGVLTANTGARNVAQAFIAAVTKDRYYERELAPAMA
jgi:catalase